MFSRGGQRGTIQIFKESGTQVLVICTVKIERTGKWENATKEIKKTQLKEGEVDNRVGIMSSVVFGLLWSEIDGRKIKIRIFEILTFGDEGKNVRDWNQEEGKYKEVWAFLLNNKPSKWYYFHIFYHSLMAKLFRLQNTIFQSGKRGLKGYKKIVSKYEIG